MTELEKYKNKLQRHDWFYMYSDSFGTYQEGKDAWLEIDAMRRRLDADGTIFNQYAPEGMRIKAKDNGAQP